MNNKEKMDNRAAEFITKNRSFYVTKMPQLDLQEQRKSYVTICASKQFLHGDGHMEKLVDFKRSDFKNYEDKSSNILHIKNDNLNQVEDSMTSSELGDFKMKILKKMSQELQTDDSSIGDLDSNMKIFKTTVQQILENFYNNLKDFENYKKKYYEILERNKGDSIAEMENFITDMIQQIGSSNSSVCTKKSNQFSNLEPVDENVGETQKDIVKLNPKTIDSFSLTAEMFQNENYMTDSTFEQNSSKNVCGNDELNENRYVEVKMNDRNMFSEVNIREQCKHSIKEPLASTENIKMQAKKLELDNYVKQNVEFHSKDKDIPVKSSCAKGNIRLNEDFFDEEKEDSHPFFIFRICNYICRKFRKNSFG